MLKRLINNNLKIFYIFFENLWLTGLGLDGVPAREGELRRRRWPTREFLKAESGPLKKSQWESVGDVSFRLRRMDSIEKGHTGC